ncbi:MAG: class I SAM-dependent methyltransferase [bacterium]|nr:class I SAM-dependent methyltransferase [bacterium]
MEKLILITYTTLYRKGGSKFARVAKTMVSELQNTNSEIRCHAIESKRELMDLFRGIESEGKTIDEFHFIGHSGMYGPMFGTVAFPEQFSPFELKEINIPFNEHSTATFHCCRSARWFAPYFSRVQNVKTFGYHWYTTFSSRKDRYKLPGKLKDGDPLYTFGCPGNKSHGRIASFKKLIGKMEAEPLKEFDERNTSVDSTYNSVADLYAETFKDITVRKDEYSWIVKHLPDQSGNVLDIGCGNGALLKALSNKIERGIGVDVSNTLLKHAESTHEKNDHISFKPISGPQLPFEENQFDVVISLLSFRYLDWDPIMKEITRVLKKEGKLLIVDMVTAPVKWSEFPFFLLSKFKHYLDRYQNKAFYSALTKLVRHPDWAKMLKYNPIRSQHEMKWYLESRFPGRKVEVINIGMNSRIIAFDSVNMDNVTNNELSYP